MIKNRKIYQDEVLGKLGDRKLDRKICPGDRDLINFETLPCMGNARGMVMLGTDSGINFSCY